MKGYLLNFYKHSPLSESILEKDEMRNSFTNEFVRNIVWSTFDRLEIREIEKFNLFRKPQDSEKHWVGERQFSMIYEPTDNGRLNYIDTPEDRCRFAFEKRNSNKDEMNNLRFFGVSIIDFTNSSYNRFFSEENSINYARSIILDSLDRLCEKNHISSNDVCFDIYGSLGGSDAVIIWLSRQFEDIMVLAEALRNSKIINFNEGIISNIYTILGIRDINNNKIRYDDVKGEFHIHLTKRMGCNIKEFKDKLCEILDIEEIKLEKSLYTLAGEHDIMVCIPGEIFVPKLYSSDGLIHMNSEVYYKNFIQANTEVSISGDLSNISTVDINLETINKEPFLIDDSEIVELVNKICESEMLEKTPYLADTLWILYSDYLRNISSAFSYPWTQDLCYQFKSCLICLSSITSSYRKNENNTKNYEFIEFIIKNVRQVILHIAQANRIFFEVPNTHLKHTGTYSKILRAYQGITKNLLKQAYLIPKIDKQKEIVPFISFDTIPIPVSISNSHENCDKLLVEIRLPYEALVDIKRYSFLLAHEIFHYISPSNRKIRNEIMGVLLISTIFSDIFYQYANFLMDHHNLLFKSDKEKDLSSNADSKNVFLNSISESLMEYIKLNFEKICALIPQYNVDNYYKNYTEDIREAYVKLYGQYGKDSNNELRLRIIFDALCMCDYSSFIPNLENTFKNDSKINEIYKKNDIEVAKILITLLEDIKSSRDFEKFSSFVSEKMEMFLCNNVIKNIAAAMSEVMPDYYMIQISKMSQMAYFKEILRIRSLLYLEENQIASQLRITLIYNYCFLKENERIGRIEKKQWTNNAAEFVNSCTNDMGESEFLWEAFCGQYEFVLRYNDLFLKYFSLLDFKLYEKDSDFYTSLELFRSKLYNNSDNDMESNIRYVERFQIQESLESLKGSIKCADTDICEYIDKTTVCNISNRSNDTYKVATDYNTLVTYLDEAASLIRDYETEEIWYRGHESDKYKLIPTLYRMGNDGKFFDLALRDVMTDLYKAFKVMSFSMNEISGNGNDTIIGTMASMQHYSLPTNILDWSPSVLTGIYFAVESTIMNEDSSTYEDYSEIYLLNPARLNEELRNQIGSSKGFYPISYIIDDEGIQGFLPIKKIGEENENSSTLPMPIYVPYVNRRIKAQNGTFTVFSLDIDTPAKDGKKDFSFMDLFEQQKELIKKNPKLKPFLSKVRISHFAKRDIVKHLKTMGVQKHTIYPELENVVKDFKTQINDFLQFNNTKK